MLEVVVNLHLLQVEQVLDFLEQLILVVVDQVQADKIVLQLQLEMVALAEKEL